MIEPVNWTDGRAARLVSCIDSKDFLRGTRFAVLSPFEHFDGPAAEIEAALVERGYLVVSAAVSLSRRTLPTGKTAQATTQWMPPGLADAAIAIIVGDFWDDEAGAATLMAIARHEGFAGDFILMSTTLPPIYPDPDGKIAQSGETPRCLGVRLRHRPKEPPCQEGRFSGFPQRVLDALSQAKTESVEA